MTFEELQLSHFREINSPLEPAEGGFAGLAGRDNSGRLVAIFVLYAHEGNWYAGLHKTQYCSRLHAEIRRALDILGTFKEIPEVRAEADPAIPRSREYLEHLGFTPTGEGNNYVLRYH